MTLRTLSDRTALSLDRGFAALLLAAQLASPLGWVYYLWLILGPGWSLLQAWQREFSVSRAALLSLSVPGLVCPVTLTLFGRAHPWAAPSIGSIYAWTTLFLWAAVVLTGRRRGSST